MSRITSGSKILPCVTRLESWGAIIAGRSARFLSAHVLSGGLCYEVCESFGPSLPDSRMVALEEREYLHRVALRHIVDEATLAARLDESGLDESLHVPAC